MKVLDLFSGIGGFSLGLERAGMKTVAFCEIDPYCRRVLEKHWPEVPIYDDVTTAQFTEGEADFIAAGWPCQNISSLGDRTGLAGPLSGLFRHVERAFRLVRPIGGLLENVADLLHRGMGEVLGALAACGYDAEWDCVPAAAVGAPHKRDRVWIVAYADTVFGRCRAGGEDWKEADYRAGQAPAAYADSQRRLQQGGAFREIRRRARDRAPQSPWTHAWQEELSQIQRMDDGLSTRLDGAGVDALGNALLPQIPELIGRAILAAEARP